MIKFSLFQTSRHESTDYNQQQPQPPQQQQQQQQQQQPKPKQQFSIQKEGSKNKKASSNKYECFSCSYDVTNYWVSLEMGC